MGRVEVGGRVIAIATRWHERDTFGAVLDSESLRGRWALHQQAIDVDVVRRVDLQSWLSDPREWHLPFGWRAAVSLDAHAGVDDYNGDADGDLDEFAADTELPNADALEVAVSLDEVDE